METRIVLALEGTGLEEEVLHFLDRSPRLRVERVAEDPATLARVVRETSPDAVVVSPAVLASTTDLDGAAVMVVDARETIEGLRAALRAGAQGFYLWPEERDGLLRGVARSGQPAAEPATLGRAIAVLGARGGAGATFLATNLAAACVARGAETVLADLDVFYADITAALGIVQNGRPRTVADLAPVADELTPEHLERVLHPHPRGFRVLLAPAEVEAALDVGPGMLAGAVRELRSMAGVVILHLPRAMTAATLAGLEAADEILLVVTLDVLAFRDARRLLRFLEGRGMADRCRLVINRANRAEVIPEDAEHVFGLRPECVLGFDRSVLRAQNRGELVAGRSGRVPRRIAALAHRVLEGAAE